MNEWMKWKWKKIEIEMISTANCCMMNRSCLMQTHENFKEGYSATMSQLCYNGSILHSKFCHTYKHLLNNHSTAAVTNNLWNLFCQVYYLLVLYAFYVLWSTLHKRTPRVRYDNIPRRNSIMLYRRHQGARNFPNPIIASHI